MPSDTQPIHLIVFAGFKRIAEGSTAEVLAQLRERKDDTPYLIFDAQTGESLDFDVHNQAGVVPHATTAEAHDDTPRGVGRPKLGVVAREVTLLPRHWDWLNRQPGGASVALRRLVQEASRVNADRDAVRASREATYRFMTAIAGALPGFEEATRALFAGERNRFEGLIDAWPADLRTHLQKLSAAGWSTPA
ncbi:hypothetical protein J2W32_004816 [Variovorax boronicumulans]|jgi:hypothetical protein|uniref:DUF2239 domain-containing protein n=1 Tax=Variovorax boronicumulans TaxID=436515 RepID=A0AAW8D230_9BURK|nr:DUF2239 family protein [Variovorax boronicumulans]MDP9895536.1 hypothetical protein [Variovorax boronicumulans]MDQ0055756.1 hypothetical protein [Variovorax boronicumulans]